ncbi:MAG: MarR family transcriptional regulator [Rubrobacter sp.]|nr:MarR family transcriptional regulator [Rubrobacter sp.]
MDLRLVEEFAAFGPAYVRWIRTRASGGISYARMRLLGVLHYSGPRIMSGLSEELGVTPRNVTALVDALEEEELVRRCPHPTDRRATVVELTERASETFGGLYKDHAAAVSEVFSGLSREEKAELVRLLRTLQDELRRREGSS